MNIEIRITKMDPSTHLLQSIKSLLNHFIKNMGLSSDDVVQVIVADKEHYESAIKAIDDHISYTNNNDYVGVGKTVSKWLDSDNIVSNIVLHSGMVDSVLSGVLKGCEVSSWANIEQQALYTMYHELGHCKDAKIRRDVAAPNAVNSSKQFKIDQVCDYNQHIVLGELSASVHSGLFMTPTVFNLELSSTILTIEKRLTYINKLKNEYSKDHSILCELAFVVSGFFWFILIQYSKLIGARIGNKELRNLELRLWKEANTEASSVISEYDRLISNAWCLYPDWGGDLFHDIDRTWQSLSLSHGFKFVHTEQGDTLYW